LADDAVARLRALYEAGDEPARTDPVFASVPVIRTFRNDVATARQAWIEEAEEGTREQQRREKDTDFLAYRDSDGRYLDFHALRVTYGTALARAGVRLQVAQQLMRHSTPVLTANVYTRLELHDLRGAVSRLSCAAAAHGATDQQAARKGA